MDGTSYMKFTNYVCLNNLFIYQYKTSLLAQIQNYSCILSDSEGYKNISNIEVLLTTSVPVGEYYYHVIVTNVQLCDWVFLQLSFANYLDIKIGEIFIEPGKIYENINPFVIYIIIYISLK